MQEEQARIRIESKFDKGQSDVKGGERVSLLYDTHNLGFVP